jgi:hypothetical protein
MSFGQLPLGDDMDIHPPHGSIHSMKDFFVHLLTITIGILIALSFEGILEWHHHRSLVREAKANIRIEILQNKASVECDLAVMQKNKEDIQKFIALIDVLKVNWNTHGSLKIIPEHAVLSATAWNTSVGTGAVSYMEFSQAQAYTNVYDLQHLYVAMQEKHIDSVQHLLAFGPVLLLDADPSPSKVRNEQLDQMKMSAGEVMAYLITDESIGRYLVDAYTGALGGK